MPTCILCGQPADYFLIYDLVEHRVEIVLCLPHLESVYAEMPEQDDSGKLKVRVEKITNDSIVPGPRVVRFSSSQDSTG
jgi:hypothetical protein